jgi:hypothetical protein
VIGAVDRDQLRAGTDALERGMHALGVFERNGRVGGAMRDQKRRRIGPHEIDRAGLECQFVAPAKQELRDLAVERDQPPPCTYSAAGVARIAGATMAGDEYCCT